MSADERAIERAIRHLMTHGGLDDVPAAHMVHRLERVVEVGDLDAAVGMWARALRAAAGHGDGRPVYQPVRRWSSPAQAQEYRDNFVLINLAGLPQVAQTCPWCAQDGWTIGETCPRSLPCQQCQAAPGEGCLRPAGDDANHLHVVRVQAAERLDEAREADGDATVPPRWPPEDGQADGDGVRPAPWVLVGARYPHGGAP
jgi:hypothetical protein